MSYNKEEIHQLVLEHGVLLRHCGSLQVRCTDEIEAQEREIKRLQAELLRVRAQVIVRDSALAWEREERLKLQATLASWQVHGAMFEPQDTAPDADADLLERSLHAADLVICQTGCVTQGSFWRVEDHCKRTGKTCMLVEQPDALRIVRIHPSGKTEQLASASWHEKETS
ncbi:DUF2325 domain-containing protein [Diaphorobacter sp. HDW4B]|uniref:DUF2325 domain-containing protein n=1 Tax=Diaphorobacter sp. HDW4B TaxID=2714925 RepID=UPI001F0F64A6|nr:DUF2325 domain-containing protein [Diaphorobacter sp. HDW4B]